VVAQSRDLPLCVPRQHRAG